MKLWLALLFTAACADSPTSGPGGDNPGGYTISGRIGTTVAARTAAPVAPRTITHVMAVQPVSASPIRTIAAVGTDGSFALDVTPGQPYVFVFVDSTAVGADMAVAMFRANTLDTVSPQLAGHLDMGDVTIDPATQTATAGVSYDDVIAELGLDPAAAEYLGSVDDLSLRYANPDIDGDGMIDLVEDHQFGIDFHVRSNMRRGSATGANFTVADMTDQFFPDGGADVATPVFNLTSAYVMYPTAMDATSYIDASMPPYQVLAHGAAYTVTVADGSTPSANTSFSGMQGGGPMASWGADYNLEDAALELPGSAGSPATIAYTLGATATTLTFTNVVTRTKASLTADGTLSIFTRLNTTGGAITSIDYTWMKRVAGAWVPATADEIAVTIGSDGGFMSFHVQPSWSNQAGVQIPATPDGTIAWTGAAVRPDMVCGLAVSYDDKLGLRHFIGGADPNPGVTCTP
ncbi:MAG: hypothetical protein ABJE66_01660 [Deltaproteobacteria bacterium]